MNLIIKHYKKNLLLVATILFLLSCKTKSAEPKKECFEITMACSIVKPETFISCDMTELELVDFIKNTPCKITYKRP
jgi:hypothetical protein